MRWRAPNIAGEILAGKPAAGVVACTNPDLARALQRLVSNENLRIYTSSDIVGCELGGALNPTMECLRQMLAFVGFTQIDVKYSPSFRYWKKLVALVTNTPQSGRSIVHARS